MPPPDSTENWTVVSSRRRRRHRTCGHGEEEAEEVKSLPVHAETSDSTVDPLPWEPTDVDEDQARVSRILQKLNSSLSRLEASAFYRRFLWQFREKIRDKLLEVAPPPGKIQIVLYGVGSIELYEPPRLQFSLALLLRRELGDSVGDVEVFDPILSAAECAAVEAMGCRVPRFNDRGRRMVDFPTLFYMPHCEATLYDNLLATNLGNISSLRQMAVLGNSFGEYGRFAEERLGGSAEKMYLLDARNFMEEISVADLASDEGNDSLFRAFNETSWHFFDSARIEKTQISAPEVG